MPDSTAIVSAVLRHEGAILVLRRSDEVGTYPGEWGVVSGYAEGNPDGQVRREIAEETGLLDAAESVRSGTPLEVTDESIDTTWQVHPYLFDVSDRNVTLSEEHTEAAWIDPTELLLGDRETVPSLWTTYERVAPSVRSIAADSSHGAAYLSHRSLEVLRDRAAVLAAERTDGWDELTGLAERLLEVRPAMTVLANRVNRAMHAADPGAGAGGVLEAARTVHAAAIESDGDAADRAAEHLGGTVMTLSRSGTVLRALTQADPHRVFVAESRPGREGVPVAETLAEDTAVTLFPDAAAAHLLSRAEIDTVAIGADTILPSGTVINKTGSRGMALAAATEGIDVVVVAARDKIAASEAVNLESGDRASVYDGPAPIDVANPTFDLTPPDYLAAILTETGRLDPNTVESIATEHRTLAEWRENR